MNSQTTTPQPTQTKTKEKEWTIVDRTGDEKKKQERRRLNNLLRHIQNNRSLGIPANLLVNLLMTIPLDDLDDKVNCNNKKLLDAMTYGYHQVSNDLLKYVMLLGGTTNLADLGYVTNHLFREMILRTKVHHWSTRSRMHRLTSTDRAHMGFIERLTEWAESSMEIRDPAQCWIVLSPLRRRRKSIWRWRKKKKQKTKQKTKQKNKQKNKRNG